jgi:16S rRNA (uracil1498-N3)-methyltransferase
MSRVLRVPHEGLSEGDLRLSEAALHYVTRVHRMKRGDVLTLFDVTSGTEAEAELLDEDAGLVRVAACRAARRASLPVTLLSALGKGDKPEQVVRDVAALGATRVIFLHSERSVARSSGSDRLTRFARIAVETSRQCGRSDVPSIEGPLSLAEFFAAPARSLVLRLVACRVRESRPLLSLVAEAEARLGTFPETEILIGPEGGLSPREIDAARAQGFLPASLGPLVLRTEVACGAALAALWLFADGLSVGGPDAELTSR